MKNLGKQFLAKTVICVTATTVFLSVIQSRRSRCCRMTCWPEASSGR